MKIAVYDSSLTDAQWALLQPLLPKPRRRGRPPTDRRLIINAIGGDHPHLQEACQAYHALLCKTGLGDEVAWSKLTEVAIEHGRTFGGNSKRK